MKLNEHCIAMIIIIVLLTWAMMATDYYSYEIAVMRSDRELCETLARIANARKAP